MEVESEEVMAIPLRERWEGGRGWRGGEEEHGFSEDFLG